MKKISLVLVVILGLIVISCKESAASKIKTENLEQAKVRDEKINLGSPIIEFDKIEYDFGTVNEGDVVEGAFKIKNVGKVNLVITSAQASCGCTVPVWPKDPIAPGQTSELTFKFNTGGKPNKQNKSITLKTNTEKVTEVVRIKGFVTPKS